MRVLLVFVCSLQSSSGVGGAGARAKTGRCDFAEGCDAAAMYVRFGLLGREQRFCHQHRQAPHRNLNNLKARLMCQHAGGCSKLGTFGPKTSAVEGHNVDRRPAPMLFCKMHKLPGDSDKSDEACLRACSARSHEPRRKGGVPECAALLRGANAS